MDERAACAQAWAFTTLNDSSWAVETIGSDASARRYFRLIKPNQSVILMDSPPATEPIAPFMDVQERLKAAGIHVPEILAAKPTEGFLLLSDMGHTAYLESLRGSNPDSLFDDAEKALVTIQTQASTAGMSHYEPAKLLSELNLFIDWFLTHHWRVEPSADELDDWDELCACLVRWALDQPQTFCHRDFMPRNLMVSQPNPGVLDFQDAVIGPISYDPISLYLDAFISWPRDYVDARLEQYRQHALREGLEVPNNQAVWLQTCDLMSTQRHLKVIGIFARIAYRDGKPRYLSDVDRFFNYLGQTIHRRPELQRLAHLLEAWADRKATLH